MLAIEGVEDVRGVRVSSLIEMFPIPSVQDVRGVVIPSPVNVFAIPSVVDVRSVGVSPSIDVNVCHGKSFFVHLGCEGNINSRYYRSVVTLLFYFSSFSQKDNKRHFTKNQFLFAC